MKYYELNRGGDETQYCEPELFGEWENEVLWKNEWRNRDLPLPITMSVANKHNPGDYPLADSHLASQRLLGILRRLNKDLEALPTRLFYKAKEPVWDTYYTILFPEYDAFDFERSECTLFRNRIVGVKKLVLSKEKLSRASPANNIFALKETKLDIICTQTAKNAIESAGIKDVRFTELPVE